MDQSGFIVSPLISVVVPVHNRPKQLWALLSALSIQTIPLHHFEVLICDDGSEEDLKEIVSRAGEELGLRACYLRQVQSGPGAARNLGIAHASSGILAFTDSDCLPAADWLESIAAAFQDPDVNFVGGLVGFDNGDSVFGICINFLMSTSFGSAGARDPRGSLAMKYYPRTPNLAIRASIARHCGGFPEDVRYGEDLTFSERVMNRGFAPRFMPNCVVLHNEVRSLREITREAFLKGRTRVKLARRLKIHEWLHMLPAMFVISVLVLCLVLLFSWKWAVPFAVPHCAYVALLVSFAVVGGAKTHSIRVFGAILAAAPATHLAYGLGYLREVCSSVREPVFSFADWSRHTRVPEYWVMRDGVHELQYRQPPEDSVPAFLMGGGDVSRVS